MKNITLIAGIILLVANLLFGSMISGYATFNMLLNCSVIVATTVLLYAVGQIALKDGFKISLSFLFAIFGFIIFLFGLFAPQRYEDNLSLMAILLIVVFEAIVLAITCIVSKNN